MTGEEQRALDAARTHGRLVLYPSWTWAEPCAVLDHAGRPVNRQDPGAVRELVRRGLLVVTTRTSRGYPACVEPLFNAGRFHHQALQL